MIVGHQLLLLITEIVSHPIHPQYVTDERGERVSVIVPIQQWQQVLDELDELNAIRLYDEIKARNEPTISLAEYMLKR